MHIDQKGIIEFEKFVLEWRQALVWAIYSYVAIKTPQGPQLLFGRILFDVKKGIHSDENFDFETEHIIAGHVVSPLSDSDLAEILTGIKIPSMYSKNGQFPLYVEDQTNVTTDFSPLHHPMFFNGLRLPSFVQRGEQKYRLIGSGSDIKRWDWELKACDKPFENFDELITYCGLPKFDQIGDSATIEIIMNQPMFISNESNLGEDDVKIVVNLSEKLNGNNVGIGYRAFHNGIIERGSIKGSEIKNWEKNQDYFKGNYCLPIPQIELIQVFMSYNGMAWHEWWIANANKQLNPRAVIHQAFDEEFRFVKEMLLQPAGGEKSRIFEGAVATLYTLLGFTSAHYGRNPKLQDGPDILASTPQGNICIMECTIDIPHVNKLDKAAQRATKIREKLKSKFPQFKIQPAVVTLLPREEAKIHFDIASKHSIAVICREDLERHLQQIHFPLNPEMLFEEIVKLIPPTQQLMNS